MVWFVRAFRPGRVGASVVVAVLAGAAPVAAAPRPIAWHDCRAGPDDETGAQLAAVGARCGELSVPLDHARPDGPRITVAVARRPATDTARRLGTLVVNTGGPGPSRDGVVLMAAGLPPAAEHGAPAVAARYDLVGIDPRFFGASTPLTCGWPTGLYLRHAQLASPDRAAFARSTATARDLASRCAGHRDVLPHASTREIARDMDAVRAALGERTISYLGWSYGSYLGAVYAQMFPGRVGRLVLDSALDPGAYGPSVTRETAPADAAALRDWAAWAARRDDRYALGTTPARVLSVIDRIDRAAARRPLQVGRHRVDAATVPGLLLTVADTDAAYAEFSAQVRVLADAARGAPAAPTPDLEAKLSLYESDEVMPAFGFAALTANQCADRAAPPDPAAYYRDIRRHRAAEPLYGPLARDITPCAFWPSRPAEPPTRVTTGRPALIVGAEGDPVAPRPGQLALRRAMPGSRMITLAHAFRHGVYLFDGTPCVDDAVNAHLLGGSLPRTDITCTRP